MNTTYPQLRITAVIHLLYATTIVAVLLQGGEILFLLSLLGPLAIYYLVTGYRLFTSKLRKRFLIVAPAVLMIFFSLTFSLPDYFRLLNYHGKVDFLGALINLGILIPNIFILYVLFISKERSYFLLAPDTKGIEKKGGRGWSLLIFGLVCGLASLFWLGADGGYNFGFFTLDQIISEIVMAIGGVSFLLGLVQLTLKK